MSHNTAICTARQDDPAINKQRNIRQGSLSVANLNKLQQVQNSLARIVLSADVRSNAKQNLADLHWLPVRARIHYKIALLTFKSITTHQNLNLPTVFYFISERHLQSTPATIVCFTMLEPELFSAVARSAMPLRQFGTHYQLISLIILTTSFYLVLNTASKRISIQISVSYFSCV